MIKQIVCATFVLCSWWAPVQPASAQTFTRLYSFCTTSGCPEGEFPTAGLVQVINGDLYGAAYYGGAYASPNIGGTIFKITLGGELTALSCAESGCPDGAQPFAGLTQATNGDLYGTTVNGGAFGGGTVFKITPSGELTTLYSFCGQNPCPDGEHPQGVLVQATNGNLYGTTENGGLSFNGTVFEITPSGTLTTLHSFCASNTETCPDGALPLSGLVQATNGDLYGTTFEGGMDGYGTIFKITLSGTLTTLYSFSAQNGCVNGEYPSAALVEATDGDLYGTTEISACANKSGTLFKITPSGTLTTLHNFCMTSGCPDGSYPYAGLMQATNGDLYGTTETGGAFAGGTVYKITPSGALTTLYSFCAQTACVDGASPDAPLMQATNGDLYGTTADGGDFDSTTHHVKGGTVFRLSLGLAPFVKTLPTSGEAGATITILGTALESATRVTFNGTAATFTVGSGSAITTTVPAGATSGTVTVTTPGGVLSSSKPFTVRE
jgi:uncharacterized repeat protein (TIGR03803 family)